jgi:RNA 2',3'-cyclic 3'-phosphodiesterase
MPRLFTGIEIPDEQREDIALLGRPLPGGSKWVEPDNLHLTLRFAGDISKAQAAELTDRLAGISADAFELRLAGLGTFGGNEPRSLWVGVEPSPELEALARANERAARACGLAPEPRVFKPHVTVANLRFATPDAVARILGRIGAFRSEPFLVGRFVTFSAKPTTGGGPYVVETAFTLRGGEFANYQDLEGSW